MNTVIYKYDIPCTFMAPGQHTHLSLSTIALPKSAEIISVKAQYNTLQCWAEVAVGDTEIKSQTFALLATGAELTETAAEVLKESYEFIDTVLMQGDTFVLHVYKRKV